MDHNIVVTNKLGTGSSAKNKLSAKKSITRNKNTIRINQTFKKSSGKLGTALSTANNGTSPISLSSGLGKIGKAGAIAGTLVVAADKVVSFGINLKEARTGNQIQAQNSKTLLKTVTTLGGNYLSGAIQNELFNKKVISRQNYSLDYGRELYNLNIDGSKTKRI